MKLRYDSNADAAAIDLVPVQGGIAKTSFPLEVNGHTLVFDFDGQNRLVSIEIWNAGSVLPPKLIDELSSAGRER